MLLTLLLLLSGFLLIGYALFILVKRRRVLAAGINGFMGLGLVTAGGFLSLLLLNIHTYQQLTREVVLAEISIGALDGKSIPVRLVFQDHDEVYHFTADEWRLDARFIKWKPWMSLLGKDPVVRLETIEERGGRVDNGRFYKRYELVSGNVWLDTFVSQISKHIGLIDSVYGSSVYMPVRSGSRYQITASLSGLVARPMNQAAKQAVIEWSSP